MINYSCDLCGSKSNDKLFKIPIAATFIEVEPCDFIPIEMNLCNKCRSCIYKTIGKIVSDKKLNELSKLALDTKMDRA